MGILGVSVGIALVCTTGLTLSTVFKFLHTFEMDVSKKDKRPRRDANEDRMESLNNRARLNK